MVAEYRSVSPSDVAELKHESLDRSSNAIASCECDPDSFVLSWRQNVDYPISDQILGSSAIRFHVRRNSMRPQSRKAGPFFNDDQSVRAIGRLSGTSVWRVDGGLVAKAPILGQNGGDIGLKFFEQLTPKAGFGGDDGDNMDVGHEGSCGLAEGQDRRRGRARAMGAVLRLTRSWQRNAP